MSCIHTQAPSMVRAQGDPGKVRARGLLGKGSEGQRGGQRPREKGVTY